MKEGPGSVFSSIGTHHVWVLGHAGFSCLFMGFFVCFETGFHLGILVDLEPTHYVDQVGLQCALILLPLLPKC